MMQGSDTTRYANINDGENKHDPSRLARWQKSGFVILAIGVVVVVTSSTTNFSFATELREGPFPYDVMRDFQGSTKDFGGYGHAHGGHFSAKVEHLEGGSKSTAFLLDHRIQYIVDGETHITDGTGQTFVGREGDLFYLAYGSNVTHYTPKKATTYTSIADGVAPLSPHQVATLQPEAFRTWVKDSARTTQVKHFPQIKSKHDKVFGDENHLYFNAIGCWKWTAKQLPSNAWINGSTMSTSPKWNFCCGVFHLNSGPPAFTSGTYKNHEELDFFIDGEFHAKDANGRNLDLKPGDLVHNARHGDVHYTTPTFGVFMSTSLSPVDDFFPTN